MSDEIVLAESSVMLGAIPTKPQDVISRASDIATELAKIVDKRKLFKNISGRKYVQVEGWNTLGAMLGVLPVEREVHKIENGYEAFVDLIRTSDGMKVGGASAICTVEERNWSNRDEYAVRSMATTRATGKAFRLGFSWIMQLAGYEATPAEEMPSVVDAHVEELPIESTAPAPMRQTLQPTNKAVWTVAQKQVLIDEHLADNDFAAKGMLGLSNLKPDATQAEIVAWGKLYRARRTSANPETMKVYPATEAAAWANNGGK